MIYEPREDSFLLQTYVKQYAHGSVLDMGSGSGIQAEAALINTKNVLAADIDDEVIHHLQKKNIPIIKSDLFSKVPKKKFDLIIFNPPYLPEDQRESMEDRLALTGGKYGWEILDRFFKEAKHFLTKEGKILIVFSSITGDIDFLLKKYKYTFKKLDEQSFFFEKLIVYLIRVTKNEKMF